MQIVKFKSQLTYVFYAAVNHLSRPLRKQKFTSAGSKFHCLRFVIGGFQSVLYVSVFQVCSLWLKLWLTTGKNAFVKVALYLRVCMFLKSTVIVVVVVDSISWQSEKLERTSSSMQILTTLQERRTEKILDGWTGV